MTWDQIAERVDGATIVHDGIECTLEVPTDRRTGRYLAELNAYPTERGKRSEAYREGRRRLGDDWSFAWPGETPESVWGQLADRLGQ